MSLTCAMVRPSNAFGRPAIGNVNRRTRKPAASDNATPARLTLNNAGAQTAPARKNSRRDIGRNVASIFSGFFTGARRRPPSVSLSATSGDHNSRSEKLVWGNKLVAGLESHWAGVRCRDFLIFHAIKIPSATGNAM